MKAKTIILLILIALFVIILIQNTQVVTIQLFFWKLSMSRIILICMLMLIGFIVGFLVAKIGRKGPKEQKEID
jgi:putative membrane protein